MYRNPLPDLLDKHWPPQPRDRKKVSPSVQWPPLVFPLRSKQTSLKRGKGGEERVFLGGLEKFGPLFICLRDTHKLFLPQFPRGRERERMGNFRPSPLHPPSSSFFELWVQNLPLLKDVYNKKIAINTIRIQLIKSQQNKDHFSLFGERVSSLLLLLLFFPTLTQVSPTTTCC